MDVECRHVAQVDLHQTPNTNGCEECLKTGDSWVHLRICLSCGHVGCCDSSKNKHATKHFHRSKHPMVRSGEPGENWAWCYVDEAFIENI
jgi:uncharacterized UBP type Zn finger protein